MNSVRRAPKIGLVLPIYNQHVEYINECLNSIERQSSRDFRLVIVIDGANEATTEAVRSASRRLTIPHTICEQKINMGIAYSLNTGFSGLTDCEYLSWVSSDNRYRQDFLSTLADALDCSPAGTVLAYSLFHLINERGERVQEPGESMVTFMRRPKEHILQHCFIGASFLFRKDAYLRAGGYNPRYEKAEDHEFWMRLLPLGNIRFVPLPLMEYRLGGKYAYTTNSTREEIIRISALASIETRRKSGDLPQVSVLLPVYNQQKYVSKAINSVLNQSFRSFHLIITDDGSGDGTWQEVNRFFDERIILLCLTRNRGQAAALNHALRFALGSYILQLDGDDWLEPHALETLVQEMERQPLDVAMVYANRQLWFEDEHGLQPGPVVPGTNYRDRYEVLEKEQTHCPRLYRKAALEAVGGWRTRLYDRRLLAEDFDLMLRLAENYRFSWVNQTLYHQRRHPGNMTILEGEDCRRQVRFLVRETRKRWGRILITETE
jgi:glycosyltransferase involved in cell wall biosynthesis